MISTDNINNDNISKKTQETENQYTAIDGYLVSILNASIDSRNSRGTANHPSSRKRPTKLMAEIHPGAAWLQRNLPTGA